MGRGASRRVDACFSRQVSCRTLVLALRGSLAGGPKSKIYGCVSVRSGRVEVSGERRETVVDDEVEEQEVVLCNLRCAAVDAEVKTARLWRGSDRQAERGPDSARMLEWLASAVAHRAELVSRSVCSH